MLLLLNILMHLHMWYTTYLCGAIAMTSSLYLLYVFKIVKKNMYQVLQTEFLDLDISKKFIFS